MFQQLKLLSEQCSKLSIYFVHPSGAEELKIVRPSNLLCAQAYEMYRNTQK